MSKWLESDRLILRPFKLSDWRSVLRYTSKIDVWKYIMESPHTDQEARQFVANNVGLQMEREGFGEHIPIILKPGHTLIGHLVCRVIPAPYRSAEIGFIIDTEYHGNGYAKEASEMLLQYCFSELELNRVIGFVDARNTPACALCEKLGMSKEAHFRKYVLIDGEWQDYYVYALLKDECKVK